MFATDDKRRKNSNKNILFVTFMLFFPAKRTFRLVQQVLSSFLLQFINDSPA